VKPNIYTIAKEASVSIASVSRALNGSAGISEATRERILRVAREFGYQPSASARGLATRTTETLALVIPQISGPYFSELIRGAESVTRAQHYHLLVYSSVDAGEDDPLLRLLPARTDGIILGTHYSTDRYIHSLHRQEVPFLVFGRTISGITTSSVQPENEPGAYALTRHLLDVHGFRRIAFISGPEDQPHSQERLSGYTRALVESEITPAPDWVVAGKFNENSGYEAAQRLLDQAERPQAIFAGNDQMAIGVMAAASERGTRVPEDLAVVGFDDIPTARYLQPALTTVNLAIFEQGVKAVELLIEQITDPEAPARTVTIPTTLVVRRSCGCGGKE
jgi:LacI family transcriptional regulator